MSSTIAVGPRGGLSSTATLKTAFQKHGDQPVRVRLAFQVYLPPLSYCGLRDHTIRFQVKSRRDFEKIHSEVVNFLESLMSNLGYGHERKIAELLTPEEQAALAVYDAAEEADQPGADETT